MCVSESERESCPYHNAGMSVHYFPLRLPLTADNFMYSFYVFYADTEQPNSHLLQLSCTERSKHKGEKMEVKPIHTIHLPTQHVCATIDCTTLRSKGH